MIRMVFLQKRRTLTEMVISMMMILMGMAFLIILTQTMIKIPYQLFLKISLLKYIMEIQIVMVY